MASPAEQVLGTVELLEMVLFNLPSRDLLLSQRVAKQWQAVIGSSSKLQVALFFKPFLIDGFTPIWLYEAWDPQQSSGAACGTLLVNDKVGESATIFKNPLIAPLFDAVTTSIFSHKASLMEALPITWREPNASWRKMMMTQPRMATPLMWQAQGPLHSTNSLQRFLLHRFSKPRGGFVDPVTGDKR